MPVSISLMGADLERITFKKAVAGCARVLVEPRRRGRLRSHGCTFICLLFCFLMLSAMLAMSEEVRIPVTISLSHPIAGAQFEFRHTDGLEFVSFERSAIVQSAIMTPTVAKDGNIHIGFFGRENSFVPSGGELNAGQLVFNYSGATGQTVAMTEVKLVEVIDQDNTKSELITDIYEIQIPLSDGEGMRIGFEERSIPVLWITVAVVAVVLFCVACVVIIRQRRMLNSRSQSVYKL